VADDLPSASQLKRSQSLRSLTVNCRTTAEVDQLDAAVANVSVRSIGDASRLSVSVVVSKAVQCTLQLVAEQRCIVLPVKQDAFTQLLNAVN
jgi:hypothetical protein